MPVIGLEAEFKVFVDDEEIVPEELWRTPAAFIARPLLKRTSKSSQLPTGGAVYFDGGVIEVVTPVIELASECTARVVRSLWEQIGFVRDELDRWEGESGKRVRLQAFSCHVNISFELERDQRSSHRTIQKLAYLLARLLPVPVIATGANRQSTGLGVRPRRDRIEMTMDFTPDPGLMAATTALMVGIVREIIGWPSYRLADIDPKRFPLIIGVEPGKHPSRNGWVVRDYHFPVSPFTTDIDEVRWPTTLGDLSLRQIAHHTAMEFRDSIRHYADPFSYRLLFSVLSGETPSLLELDGRPAAYEDVGRSTRWGSVLPELENFSSLMNDNREDNAVVRRRAADLEQRLAPPWRGEATGRRTHVTLPARVERRDATERRASTESGPSPRLTRSAYEKVFMKLGSGSRLQIGNELLTPVAVKGWYHSVFKTANGEERLLSIDQILQSQGSWRS